MKEYYLTRSAIIVMLYREFDGQPQILLQKRKNTGFGDGMWDLSCSGHVEENEAMTQTVCRECEEELGVTICRDDVRFFTMIHKADKPCGLFYYNGYFYVKKWVGEPKIKETDKCSQIAWFSLDSLPMDLLPDRKKAIEAFHKKISYIEYGW